MKVKPGKLFHLLLLLFLLATPLVPYNSSDSLFFQDLQNAGHILVFGVISLSLLYLLGNTSSKSRIHQYFLAMVFVIITGGGCEILQMYIPGRTAELGDLGRDIAGAFAFLGIYSLFDRKLHSQYETYSRKRKAVTLFASLAVFLIGLSSAMLTHFDQYRAFPSLMDFHSKKMMASVSTGGIEQSYISSTKNGDALVLDIKKASRWPYLRINNIIADWSGYKTILIDIHSSATAPIRYSMLLDDHTTSEIKPHSFRYNDLLQPGRNQLKIALPGIADKRLNIKHMRMIWLAFPQPAQNCSLTLHAIRLSTPSSIHTR